METISYNNETEDGVYLSEIAKLAFGFRQAITKCDLKTLPFTMHSFPHGACGDAALLLAKYLEENGYGVFDCVLGQRDGYSHAWLQRGDLIVDITADQFKDQVGPVIVTRDNRWHSAFSGEILNVADFYIYDLHTVSSLKSSYEKIRKHIGIF